MDLAKIKKVDWQYLVNRNEALLFRSITDNSYRYFKKVTGISWRASHILRFGEGELYHSKKELDKLRSIFKKGGVDLFYDFRQHLLFYIRSLDKLVQRIEKINYSKLSKPQLVKLLKDYFQADLNVHNFLLPMPVADGVISQMILELLPKASAQKKQKWLSILIYPLKENEHVKEERSFYKLAFAYKNKKKNFDHLLKMHLKRFSWIGARGYWWDKAWTKEDIKNRLKSFLAQSQNPTKKFKHLDNIQKQRNKTSEKLLKELNIKKSSLLYKLIQLAKEFVYLRPWRTDIIYSFGYRAHHLFYEAAKRAGLKENDIVYLAFSEVIKMARTAKIPITKKELTNRKKYFATVLLKDKYAILSGKEWQAKLKYITHSPQKATKEIKGNVAFPGKIKGTVKVVLSGDDIKKVKQGDILVAVMTFPNFVSAMEKAAAFVTNEGGILCHAAIVSREMKKPCIIATKIATQVLKDGDRVEVDARKGIVKKI